MKQEGKRAMIIAFEGIDQSGKETQAARLAERLRREGKKVHLAGFPDYGTPIGMELRRFLAGERQYGPEVRQLLYAANRFEKLEELRSLSQTVDYILIDRYIPSGLAYGVVNGLDLDWCWQIEKDLPQPDHVLLFDLPVEESFRRKREGRDVYERRLDFLNQVRKAYLELAERYGWKIFHAVAHMDQLEEEVWNYFRQYIHTKD